MTIADRETSNADTIAELLESLGGVPAERVLYLQRPATEGDLLKLLERQKRICELIDGTLVEKPMGWKEAFLALELGRLIGNFVKQRRLGVLAGSDGPIRLRPGLVRLPDLAYFSWERLPENLDSLESIPSLIPDLAVEVLSKSNTPGEMENKRREYFTAGVSLVWIVDPEARKVEVYTSPSHMRVLAESDTLDGGEVLPGLEISLRELFGELDRTAGDRK